VWFGAQRRWHPTVTVRARTCAADASRNESGLVRGQQGAHVRRVILLTQLLAATEKQYREGDHQALPDHVAVQPPPHCIGCLIGCMIDICWTPMASDNLQTVVCTLLCPYSSSLSRCNSHRGRTTSLRASIFRNVHAPLSPHPPAAVYNSFPSSASVHGKGPPPLCRLRYGSAPLLLNTYPCVSVGPLA
jgi:hypothetical protein